MTRQSVKCLSESVSRVSNTMLIIIVLCSGLLLSLAVQNAEANPDIGYWIIVEGANFHREQSFIEYGCMQVYSTLVGVGYSTDRIKYVKAATEITFEQAIQWAGGKADSSEPLWIYMFDHGGNDTFDFRGGTGIYYHEMDDLLEAYIPSDVNINMIIACCHSGTAIDDLSYHGTQRIIITTCTEYQNSSFYLGDPIPKWEAFSVPFWDKIKEYQTVKDAFNYACYHIKNVQEIPDQDPLLDDNGDGVGHTGDLPNSGDGDASNLHIGSHVYTPPVGGVLVPPDKFGLLTPYIGLALTIIVATVAAAIYFKRAKVRKDKQ